MKKILIIGLVALFFIGCSTTSTIKERQNYSDNVSLASTVNKNESISVIVLGKTEDKEEMDFLRTELIDQFQQNGFTITGNNPMVTIKVEITNVKRVSRGTRMLLGALAGKAMIEVGVVIIKNNQTVSIFELKTESISFTGWGGSPGTTKQALSESAEKLVKIVANGKDMPD
ncbi:MAG: hypothetical protein M1147_05665 [Nitrospirae bacterium]|nr:hypothetical protein [Nitrospirota bacterium]MCL5977605.1 hypothetical protein [Nitrospirota bacterium]